MPFDLREMYMGNTRGACRLVFMGLPFACALAVANVTTGTCAIARDAVTCERNGVIASAGREHAITVRGSWRSQHLPLLQAIAQRYASAGLLDIAYDDYASFGRFCDRDDPFHVLIHEGSLTSHQENCRRVRFSAGTLQPEVFLVGHLRVVFVAHKENPIPSLNFAVIRQILIEMDKAVHWKDIGGVGSAAVRCCGPAETTWPRQLIQDKCMTQWRDTEQSGVRELQRLAFRADIAPCDDAKEVVAKVRADRQALGFFACCEPLTPRDLQGVKVLPVAENEGGSAVVPPLNVADEQEGYPLAEPVCLYVHPSAPPVAREFGKFATGPEAAKIIQQFGVWPAYLSAQERQRQRLADAKAGKGGSVSAAGPETAERTCRAFAWKYVEAKQAVQLKYQKKMSQSDAIATFFEAGGEVLLLDKEPEDHLNDRLSTAIKTVPIGKAALGVVVHPDNNVKSLPLDELRQIGTGEVKSWPAATGTGTPIRGYGLQPSDPVMRIYQDKLAAKGAARAAGGLKLTAAADTQKVILAVARDPAAIGFVDLSQMPKDDMSVRLLAIMPSPPAPLPHAGEGSYLPAPGQVPDDYPLVQPVTLYVSPTAGQAAKDFADFLAENTFPEILAEHRLLPPKKVDDMSPQAKTAIALEEAAVKPVAAALPPMDLAVGDGADVNLPGFENDALGAQASPAAAAKTVAPVPADGMPEQPAAVPASPTTEPKPVEAASSKPVTKEDDPATGGLSAEYIWLIVAGIGGLAVLAVVLAARRPKQVKHRKSPEIKIDL
jgi:ABC-type phosphate transport system substrate-binding protein